jgi:hypothetical protein
VILTGASTFRLKDGLSRQAIARLFSVGVNKHRGYVAAVVLIAASTARWKADRDGWNGETERLLALEAVHDAAALKRAALQAAKIVAEHWEEITSEA